MTKKEFYKNAHAKLIYKLRNEKDPDELYKTQNQYWKLVKLYHNISSATLYKFGFKYWDAKFEREIGYLKEQHEKTK